MEDLIKQLSEGSPALDGLLLELERTLNSDFGPGSFEDDEFDIPWD